MTKREKSEMVERLGKWKAKALMRELEEKNISVFGFFMEHFNNYGAEIDTHVKSKLLSYHILKKRNLSLFSKDPTDIGSMTRMP